MPLPTSGEVSFLEAYEERFGDGQTPSSGYSLADLKTDFQLSGSDSTDIFYGMGRPVPITLSAINIGTNGADLRGRLSDVGGIYDGDWGMRYREVGAGSWTFADNNIPYVVADEGDIVTSSPFLASDTEYEFQFGMKNIHNGGNYVFGSILSFTTDP